MKSANQTPETPAARNIRETFDSIHLALLRIARMQDNQQSKEN